MFFVTISFVIFNASDLGQAALYIKSMFGFGDISLISEEFIYYLRSYIVIILLAITGATPLPAKVATSMSKHKYGKKIISIIEPLMLIVLLLICTAYLVDGSFNPFLYFRF